MYRFKLTNNFMNISNKFKHASEIEGANVKPSASKQTKILYFKITYQHKMTQKQ